MLGYEVAKDLESYISAFSLFTNIFVYCLTLVSMIILFVLESSKFNKHMSFFKVINQNKVKMHNLLQSYSFLYLGLIVFFVTDFILLLLYIICYSLFIFLLKRKIKSRFPWI